MGHGNMIRIMQFALLLMQPFAEGVCVTSFGDYPECRDRIDWMTQHWNDHYYTRKGVDGRVCSIQAYLHEYEGHCPPCECESLTPGHCVSSYAGYPQCQARLDWMSRNWNTPYYINKGVDGRNCSIQHYLNEKEGPWCPPCTCDDIPGDGLSNVIFDWLPICVAIIVGICAVVTLHQWHKHHDRSHTWKYGCPLCAISKWLGHRESDAQQELSDIEGHTNDGTSHHVDQHLQTNEPCAMTNAVPSGHEQLHGNAGGQNRVDGTKECIICNDNAASACVVDCGHAQFCHDCLNKYRSQGNATCPICKRIITQVITVYT